MKAYGTTDSRTVTNFIRWVHIKVSDDKMAEFLGGVNLKGAQITACDLRAGAAFIIAGLVAEGTTEIDNIKHIQRGYEDICGKLRGVGADIELVIE